MSAAKIPEVHRASVRALVNGSWRTKAITQSAALRIIRRANQGDKTAKRFLDKALDRPHS